MYTSAIIAETIKSCNKRLFTYPGGTIAPLFHECSAIGVEIICAKSEQGAGFMAIADAIVSQTPAFVAVTSGPGATNIITCIADAYYDSIPLIVLTGQVGTQDLARPQALRQRGFQEVPIIEIVQKITKSTFQPHSPQELADNLAQALTIANQGRPGPVLIDLPMNVQMSHRPDNSATPPANIHLKEDTDAPIKAELLKDIRESLIKAKRPLILIGGGAISAHKELRTTVSRLKIPTLTTMRGIGAIPTNDSLFLGWIGHTGLPWANWALAQSDWIICLGSRLDVRQTGSQTNDLCNKTIFQVDIDLDELRFTRIADAEKVQCKVETLLKLLNQDNLLVSPDTGAWQESIKMQRAKLPLQDNGTGPGVAPDDLLRRINSLTLDYETDIVTGVGSHQQWAARYFSYDIPHKQLFTSAGHGTMGYALPVALGIKKLKPNRLVICIDGDGSFQMNIQELALINEQKLPIKIILMNNARLGIVSQFQNITFKDDPVTGSFHNPDFTRIAEAYGIKCWNLTTLDDATIKAWLNEPGPALLHAHIQHDAPVSPMLLGGQKLDSMWFAHEVNQQ